MVQEAGGWYGGGAAGNYSSTSRTRAAGGAGGSGFVWTQETSSNVPSGYSVSSKYYLTNATTVAGNTTFESSTGGTETGHKGNGYAKITWIGFKENDIIEDEAYVKDGLVLYYDGINNTGSGHSAYATTWKDLSGNNNDGIITGGTWQNNSLKFTTSNESNGVETKQNFPIDYNNTFNIIFKLSSINDVEALLGSRTTYSNGLMLFNYNSNNSLTLDTNGSNTRIQLGDRLQANKVYDITATFSGTTVKLYVNGGLTKTMSFTDASLNFPLTVFTAGGRSNSLGEIYSVKVYNRALTNEEIVQNYNIDKEKYNY